MTVLLYIAQVLCATGQSVLGKQYAKKGGTAAVFNLNKALSGSAVFLLVWLLFGTSFHMPTLFYGILYGLFLSVSMFTGFRALALGPMALTGMIASFSLIIPFVFGVAVWKEPITILGWVGIALLCLSVAIIQFHREKGLSLTWAIYAFLTLLANGVCSLIQKYHQICYPGEGRVQFMLVALVVVAISSFVLYAVKAWRGKIKFSLSPTGIAAGAMNGTAGFITLYMAAAVGASVLFPLTSVLQVMVTLLAGWLFFKERISARQAIGLFLGMFACLLLNL